MRGYFTFVALPVPVPSGGVYTLLSSAPMKNISMDSVGPFPEDVHGNRYILVIIDEFSKFALLHQKIFSMD